MSWCPTADCKFAFIKDDNNESDKLSCPLCKKT